MKTEKKNSIWIFIVSYILLIYLTLPLMRPILNYIYNIFGRERLVLGTNILLFITVFFVTINFAVKGRNKFKGIVCLLGIFGAWMLMAGFVDIPEERVHFLEYGILGWMVYIAGSRWRQPFLASLLFCAGVGLVDEIIQGILPNRFWDLRDVGFNAIGGFLGILTRIVWYENI